MQPIKGSSQKCLMGCFVEVYIDETIVKSLGFEQHLEHMEEFFCRLRKHKVRLNPTNYQFGVKLGVFLGHVISEKGIKAHPNQVKAIMSMLEPRTLKEIQILTRRIAALTRFIPHMSDRCAPFFKLLQGKNIKKSGWGTEQSDAFRRVKEYLLKSPVLDAPKSGKPLYLYLAISKISLSAILFKCERSLQKPIFFFFFF